MERTACLAITYDIRVEFSQCWEFCADIVTGLYSCQWGGLIDSEAVHLRRGTRSAGFWPINGKIIPLSLETQRLFEIMPLSKINACFLSIFALRWSEIASGSSWWGHTSVVGSCWNALCSWRAIFIIYNAIGCHLGLRAAEEQRCIPSVSPLPPKDCMFIWQCSTSWSDPMSRCVSFLYPQFALQSRRRFRWLPLSALCHTNWWAWALRPSFSRGWGLSRDSSRF